MDKDWHLLLKPQNQLIRVMETNQTTEKFGLVLDKEEAELIIREHDNALRRQRRVEFGASITPKIIYEFCDSDFIDKNHYVGTIIRLQEIFYLYKNEMHDEISDDELLHFMREQYDNVCFGDLEYLENTCLAIFARAVREGYRGYQASEGRGEYAKFDEVQRWDCGLYLEALKELF